MSTLTKPNGQPMLDINGKLLEIGDQVLMPEPNETDTYLYGGFYARVVDTNGEYLIVEDGDSDFFDIEPERVDATPES